MFKVNFQFDVNDNQTVEVTATASDVSSFDADDLVIVIDSDDNDLAYMVETTEEIMDEVMEEAIQHLYNQKYAAEVEF